MTFFFLLNKYQRVTIIENRNMIITRIAIHSGLRHSKIKKAKTAVLRLRCMTRTSGTTQIITLRLHTPFYAVAAKRILTSTTSASTGI